MTNYAQIIQDEFYSQHPELKRLEFGCESIRHYDDAYGSKEQSLVMLGQDFTGFRTSGKKKNYKLYVIY